MLSFEIGDVICHYWGQNVPFLAPKMIFLGVYGDETLLIAKMGQNLIWWTLFGIQCNKDLLSKTVIPLVQGPPLVMAEPPWAKQVPLGMARKP